MIAIKTADLTQDFKKYADRIMQGEKVLISRPKNENLVILTEKEYNRITEAQRKAALLEFKKNLEDMQRQSIINGTSEMTMEEIDEIIAEVRKEKRGEE